MATKKQKRLAGAARQAENRRAYEEECRERLDKTREHRAEQQRLLMAEKARKDAGSIMRVIGEGAI